MWTAVARELKSVHPDRKIVFAFRSTWRDRLRLRKCRAPYFSEVFENNPNITREEDLRPGDRPLYVYVDTPKSSYHSRKDNQKVEFKTGGHAINFMARPYGVSRPAVRCDLFFTDGELRKAEEMTQGLSGFLVVEPHAKDDFTPNKEWFFERWREAVDILGKEVAIVQVGLGGKPVLDGVVDLTGKLTFRETVAVMGRAQGFLGTEGGLMHAASAVDIRSVIVFGGFTPPYLTSYEGNIDLYTDLPCAPCGLRTPCPYDNDCMKRITVDQVVDAVRRVLSGNRP